jgi:hypothetical protein
MANPQRDDGAAIDVTKPKLEKFRGNNRDTLDIKTWCLQVSRLDTVNKLGDANTAIIVMEALREQALSWELLLQDEKPASAASWALLKPLLLEKFDGSGGGGQKQGGAQRYRVAAVQVTGEENAAAPASLQTNAGMHEMKAELAAILLALAAISGKKGQKAKPPGGAPPRGPRKPPGGLAGGAGTGRSTGEAMGPQHARDWIKCFHCRQLGQHIAAECTRTQAECDKLTPGAKLPPSGPARDLLFNPN